MRERDRQAEREGGGDGERQGGGVRWERDRKGVGGGEAGQKIKGTARYIMDMKSSAIILFIGSCLATKDFIGNLLAMGRGWVIIK